MDKNKKRLILAGILIGIPSILTLARVNDAKSAVKLPTTSSVKVPAVKPPIPAKPTNSSITKGSVSSKINSFNKSVSKPTVTNKPSVSVGKLKVDSGLKSNLESILSSSPKKPSTSKNNSVGKLNTSSNSKVNSLFGGNNKPQGLDLSKLPAVPPPPPEAPKTTGTTTNTTAPTLTLNTQSTSNGVIPEPPPLPTTGSLVSGNKTNLTGGSLKGQLTNKVNSGLKKTQSLNIKKPSNSSIQDNLMTELKNKLQKSRK